MKRKLLIISIMVLAIACLMSVSIFAKAYDANRTTIDYKGQSVPVHKESVDASTVNNAIKADTSRQHTCNLDGLTKMADNNAYAILKDTNGGLTAYPSWYIIDASGTEIYEICYAYLNSLSATTGKTYEEGAIVYMEFPQGMTGVRNNGVFGKKSNTNPYEMNVTDFHIPKTVSSIASNAFNSMPKLENVFIEPGNTISQINSGTFSNSSVKYVQLENLTEITSIDGFTNCGITGDIDLSKSTKLVDIQAGCFEKSKNIGKITLPDSVETIGANAFQEVGNAYLASPYLPKNLKSVGARFFAYCGAINDTFIFPEGVTSIGSEPFQDSKVAGGPTGKELNLVFLGKVTGCVYLNGNGHQKHADKVTVYFAKNTLAEYNSNGFYIKPSGSSTISVPGAIRAVFCMGNGEGTNGNVTGIEYVYITSTTGATYTADYVNHADYGFDFDNHTCYCSYEVIQEVSCGYDGIHRNTCIVCDEVTEDIVPATGKHEFEADTDCSTEEICDVCKKVAIEALAHDLDITLTYANGYASEGARREICKREGCTHDVSSTPKALVSLKGYSKNEAGSRMCVGYEINYVSMAEYKSIHNIEGFEFGTVMSTLANATDGKPLEIVDGKVEIATPDTGKGNIIKANLTNESCTTVTSAIVGDYTNYQDLQILLCAYIYDGQTLSYIQKTLDASASSVAIKDLPVA